MTQEEIRKKRDELSLAIAQHNREIAKLRFEWRLLKEDCTHPNKYVREDYKLEKTWYCDDCGWSS